MDFLYIFFQISAVQMWGVGWLEGRPRAPRAGGGRRNSPSASGPALGRPAKLEKLKYNIFGLHINSPQPFNSVFAAKEVWNVSINISNSHSLALH